MRNQLIDNQNIQVDVSGNRVTFNGRVESYYQKDIAGRIAWEAEGAWVVDTELVIM